MIVSNQGDINSKRRINRLIMATSANTVWNEDIVIRTRDLRFRLTARTVTFVEVDFIDREDLFHIFDEYPSGSTRNTGSTGSTDSWCR